MLPFVEMHGRKGELSRARYEFAIGGGLVVGLLVSVSCRSKGPESSASKSVASVAPSASSAPSRDVHELRQLWPQSGGVVLSAQVAFRWRGAASHVEISRSHGFEKGVEQLVGSASGSDPQSFEATSPELADGVWFWRVNDAGAASHAVWSFRVHHVQGVRNAGNLLAGTDVNCDGRSDILMKGKVLLGSEWPPIIQFQLGSLAVKELLPEPDLPDATWGELVGIGDVDGDGCDDVVTTATRQTHNMTVNIPVSVPILFRGRPNLAAPWQASSRLAHEVTRLGDIDGDGYADVAACSDQDCTVFRGGPTGVQDAPFFTFKGYQSLLGGDFDADGALDLWAATRTSPNHSYLSFFSGKSLNPSVPSSAFGIPQQLNALPAAGLIANGKSSILGFTGFGCSDSFWRVNDSAGDATVERWPEGAHVAATWPHFQGVSAWEFVPFAGPGARGVLVIVPAIVPVESGDPPRSFLQYGVTAAGAPFFLARSAITELDPTEGIVGFSRTGDTNGDGYDDLLVHAFDAMGDPLWYQFLGSATGFTFKQRL